ncbi:hypothetical protein RJ639_029050 [Escallonia herrerae]|uniref:Uncharacterized protein n=1 Tax=Escallonia herrerae TaxID=1293975 RepID=A0AA89BFP1_9ASTE|nr:hypothetical protein RJ639_029050 [Escallonia herrerae]
MRRRIERLLVGVITGVEADAGQTRSNSLARRRGTAKPCVECVGLILLEPVVSTPPPQPARGGGRSSQIVTDPAIVKFQAEKQQTVGKQFITYDR